MPRQNRVTPAGDLVAVPNRGTMMGNRGVLHNADQQIVRPWQLRRWIVCEVAFRGRHREVMTLGRYTELFFLDEATALAAGHRPCFECRRTWFRAFQEVWRAKGPLPTADEIDRRLHAERLDAAGRKRAYAARLADLPDGVFVGLPPGRERPHLLWSGYLLAWSAGGYTDRIVPRGGDTVDVLTPKSTVAAIRAGYVPAVHSSAS